MVKKKQQTKKIKKGFELILEKHFKRSICESLWMAQPFTILYLCWLSIIACGHIYIYIYISTSVHCKMVAADKTGEKKGKQECEKWICEIKAPKKRVWKEGEGMKSTTNIQYSVNLPGINHYQGLAHFGPHTERFGIRL